MNTSPATGTERIQSSQLIAMASTFRPAIVDARKTAILIKQLGERLEETLVTLAATAGQYEVAKVALDKANAELIQLRISVTTGTRPSSGKPLRGS